MSDQVEEVKQKTDIVSLVGERVKLVRSGRNFKALCPFHGERTPSFMVSPELGIYKCFGCGKAGDVYNFLQEYEGMEFVEALEFLAKKAGVRLSRLKRDSGYSYKKLLYGITHLASEYYSFLLVSHDVGSRARRYLKERGMSKRAVENFHLGYAPESWDSLVRYLAGRKKYKIGDIEKVGLVLKRKRVYDRFRNRIIFPLRDAPGNVVGFAGRSLPGKEKAGGKYINSPETVLYHKSEHVYGLHENRSFIKKKDQVVVVEGEFDVISSWQVGVKNVVAVKGTSLTEGQVELVRRYSRNVVLALDADTAGDKATKRGIALADSASLNVRVALLSGGKDPDAIAQTSGEVWKKFVSKSISVYDFYLASVKKRFDLSAGIGKKQAAEEIIPVLSNITNSVERAHYIKKFGRLVDVSDESVIDEMRRHERKQVLEEGVGVKAGKVREAQEERDRWVILEEYLLSLALQGGGVGD